MKRNGIYPTKNQTKSYLLLAKENCFAHKYNTQSQIQMHGRTNKCTCTRMYTHTHAHAHARTHAHTPMHTCTHPCTHTHALTLSHYVALAIRHKHTQHNPAIRHKHICVFWHATCLLSHYAALAIRHKISCHKTQTHPTQFFSLHRSSKPSTLTKP